MRLLTLLLLAVSTISPVSIKVDRVVFYPGTPVTVVCSVPRRADNRRVEGAIVPFTSSEHQLDGEDAAVTHRFTFQHVPCDAAYASCILWDKFDHTTQVIQTLKPAGCEP